MNAVQQVSENLTFWELMGRTNVEIPMIQRDYAQGRDGKERVRNDFLKALSEAIQGAPIELDFIYGSNKEGALQPLDGQQRLTTLFLLHWYAATKEGCLDSTVEKRLKGFSYRTRRSSHDFCGSLIDSGVPDWNGRDDISASIEDAHWFCPWWKKDPTIKSMLTMLSAIQAAFTHKAGLWAKLTEKDQRAITFNYIELENFGLSDDLYIKMNARGKQLSTFECFKAGFEKRICDQQWDKDRKVTETFPYMIDTIWADLIWDNGSDIESFDRVFTLFISSCAITSLAFGTGITSEREKRIQELFQDPEAILPDDFHKEGYEHLRQCLDAYCDASKRKLSLPFPLWNYLPDDTTSLFSLLRGRTPLTYPQRVLLYAQSAYLIKQDFDLPSFSDWMRVVRNIVENSTIDSSTVFVMAINLIGEIAEGCSNIYGFLSKEKVASKFALNQVKEEIIKARLITADAAQSQVISEAEDTNFCKGEVGFLFKCIGYPNTDDTFDSKEFHKITDIIKMYLSGEDVSNEFRRALLTIKDYKFYQYWSSWVYAVEAPKHRLIVDTKDLKKNFGDSGSEPYLRDLLKQLTYNELPTLLAQYTPPPSMPNWQKRLIQEPTLLDKYCRSHCIAVPSDSSCCYLLDVGRPRDISSCYKVE